MLADFNRELRSAPLSNKRLARGLPLLGPIHTLLADTDVCPAGRAVKFANHIEPGAVLAGTLGRPGSDEHTARAHALATFLAIDRALQLVVGIPV